MNSSYSKWIVDLCKSSYNSISNENALYSRPTYYLISTTNKKMIWTITNDVTMSSQPKISVGYKCHYNGIVAFSWTLYMYYVPFVSYRALGTVASQI